MSYFLPKTFTMLYKKYLFRTKKFQSFCLIKFKSLILFYKKIFFQKQGLSIVKKSKSMYVEVKDGCLLSSKEDIYETILINIINNSHDNLILFSILDFFKFNFLKFIMVKKI